MALSGIFLVVFLAQHFLINITSVFSEEIFNFLSHFMGNNPIVQFILQPILILLLNHATAVDLQNNDFFNRKSTYNAQSFFRNNHEIQFFGDKVISSDNESLINKYNIKSNILT